MNELKKIAVCLLSFLLLFSLVGCGSKEEAAPLLSESNLVGTWTFTKGDLYKNPHTPTVNFEIYKGGTARLNYEDYKDSRGQMNTGVHNNFTWEIVTESDIVNVKMNDFVGFGGTTTGFEIIDNGGTLELHSVDGKIILVKDKAE